MAPTTLRARSTSATRCRCCARPAHECVAHLTEDDAVGPRHQHPRRPGDGAGRPRSAGILERHMLAGVTITDPASTVIDVRGADRRGHGRSSRTRSCAASTRDRQRLHGRPDDDADRLRAGRRRRAVLHSYLDGCEVRERVHGRPVHAHPPGHRAAGAGQGGLVRRDQELGHRRGHQGPAPHLHRGRRRGRGVQHRRRRRSPPTTTARRSTAP